ECPQDIRQPALAQKKFVSAPTRHGRNDPKRWLLLSGADNTVNGYQEGFHSKRRTGCSQSFQEVISPWHQISSHQPPVNRRCQAGSAPSDRTNRNGTRTWHKYSAA